MSDTRYSRREELVNAATHGVGAVASLLAGAALIVLATLSGDFWRIVGAATFSASLVLLYTASTAYHSAPGGQVKRRLEIFDHCAIFVLIAGTYTPFTLVTFRELGGWTLFGVVWSLAVAGVALKLLVATRFSLLSTAIYIGMGWLVVASGPMLRALPFSTAVLLAAGGIIYTAGTIFYHNRRIPYAHAIWHLFVIGGSVLHYFAVASQVAG